MKLYIIAGHGVGDPGAVNGGYREADLVRSLAVKLKNLGGDNVEVLDMNRNWYADNGISTLTLPKDAQLLELHMDSASASAKGGHVIIKAGIGGADKYDNALASTIGGIFPGRANLIVERSDLANPNRAYARGINYRLLEVCFISNPKELGLFTAGLDKIARAILHSFDIKEVAQPKITFTSKTPCEVGLLYQHNSKSGKFEGELIEDLGKVCKVKGLDGKLYFVRKV